MDVSRVLLSALFFAVGPGGLFAAAGVCIWLAVSLLGSFGPAVDEYGFRVALVFIALVLAVLMAAFGLIRAFFLAAFHKAPTRIPLTRQEGAALFDMVGTVAQMAGVVRPRKIELEMSLEIRCVRRKGGVTLILGLPLVAALQVDQLAGLLAHEVCHTGEGLGGDLHRGVVWTLRAGRRPLEQGEGGLAHQARELLGPVLGWVVSIMVDGVYRLLYTVSRGLGLEALRGGERAADRLQVQLVGARGFEATLDRLATAQALVDGMAMDRSLSLGVSPAGEQNLAMHIGRSIRLPPMQLNALTGRIGNLDETRWQGVHSTHRARLETASASRARARFEQTAPAACLIADFAIVANRLQKASVLAGD